MDQIGEARLFIRAQCDLDYQGVFVLLQSSFYEVMWSSLDFSNKKVNVTMSDCVSVTSISFYKKHWSVLTYNYYAPNFKEVGGEYCFWVVRPSVTFFDALHNFRTVNATVLKFSYMDSS